jgi:hypothetical protein
MWYKEAYYLETGRRPKGLLDPEFQKFQKNPRL